MLFFLLRTAVHPAVIRADADTNDLGTAEEANAEPGRTTCTGRPAAFAVGKVPMPDVVDTVVAPVAVRRVVHVGRDDDEDGASGARSAGCRQCLGPAPVSKTGAERGMVTATGTSCLEEVDATEANDFGGVGRHRVAHGQTDELEDDCDVVAVSEASSML